MNESRMSEVENLLGPLYRRKNRLKYYLNKLESPPFMTQLYWSLYPHRREKAQRLADSICDRLYNLECEILSCRSDIIFRWERQD